MPGPGARSEPLVAHQVIAGGTKHAARDAWDRVEHSVSGRCDETR